MDFQQKKYAKGAAGYDERIRNLFPFYELFTLQSMPYFVSAWDPEASY